MMKSYKCSYIDRNAAEIDYFEFQIFPVVKMDMTDDGPRNDFQGYNMMILLLKILPNWSRIGRFKFECLVTMIEYFVHKKQTTHHLGTATLKKTTRTHVK